MRSYLTVIEPRAREESQLPTQMSMIAVSHAVRDGKRVKKKVQKTTYFIPEMEESRLCNAPRLSSKLEIYKKAFIIKTP